MTINGIDVFQAYGIKQWNVEKGFAEIKNESCWETGSPIPFLTKSIAGFKKIKVSVLIKGQNRKDIWEKASNFLLALMEPAVLRLDDFDHFFSVILTNATQVESSLKRFHRATLELQGYEYAEKETMTIEDINYKKYIEINNFGTMESPAVIKALNNSGLEVTQELSIFENVTGPNGAAMLSQAGKISFFMEKQYNISTKEIEFDGRYGTIKYKRDNNNEQLIGDAGMVKINKLFALGRGKTTVYASGSLTSTGVCKIEISYYPMFL